jgi:hypothetical protein
MTSAKKSNSKTDDTITLGDTCITLDKTLRPDLRRFVVAAAGIARNTKQKLAASWLDKCLMTILQMHYIQTNSDKESSRVEQVLDEEIEQHEFVREMLISEIKRLRQENESLRGALDYQPEDA